MPFSFQCWMLRCQWLKKEYLAFTIVPLDIPNIQSMLFYGSTPIIVTDLDKRAATWRQ